MALRAPEHAAGPIPEAGKQKAVRRMTTGLDQNCHGDARHWLEPGFFFRATADFIFYFFLFFKLKLRFFFDFSGQDRLPSRPRFLFALRFLFLL